MYRLLIVDDEPEVANWIHDIFEEQKQLDLEIFVTCSAREALALLDKVKFDIVLSDIMMPGITGIQLMENIKASWPRCRIIFLTGFSEFDYVYKAIQNHGVRYILKSEEDENIIKAVAEAVAEIEASHINEDILKKAREQALKLLPLQQKEFLQDIIDGFYSIGDLKQETFDLLEISLDISRRIILLVGRFDNPPVSGTVTNEGNVFYSLKSICEQYFPLSYSNMCFIDSQRDLICLLQPKAGIYDNPGNIIGENIWDKAFLQLKGTLEDIQAIIRKNLGTTISFTLCGEIPSFHQITEKCHILKQLQGYRVSNEKEMIILYKNDSCFNPDESVDTDNTFKNAYTQIRKVRLLEDYLETGRKTYFFELLPKIIECLRNIKSPGFSPAVEIYYSVSIVFLGYINRRNLVEKIAAMVDLHKLTRLDEYASWNDAVDYLYGVADAIFNLQSCKENEWAMDAVTRLQRFIDTHLNEDLSLIRLADIVCLNPTYLSRLFKQVTSVNLSEYILEMRIQNAQNLLRQTSKKINQISAELGYDSPHSFTRFFKNVTKVTPQEYRAAFINK